MTVYRETRSRSLAKAISWRLVGTVTTAAIVWLLTKRADVSLAIGGLDFVLKAGLYWAHERVWDGVGVGRTRVRPAVVWLTGLSGAGKTTLGAWLGDVLRRAGHDVEHLDGDTVRSLFPHTGFTRDEREAHIRRVGYLAAKLEAHGVVVIASFISPYEETREYVRDLCKTFVEVYVATPIEVCEQRDVKGLYARARRGELDNLTGVDDPYEPPRRPDVIVDMCDADIADAGGKVLRRILEQMACT